MATIALVSCVKQKQENPCPAREMYTSALFSKARSYAEASADAWFILSAKYGLVEPDETIAPYEQTLKGASASDRTNWASQVHAQLSSHGILVPETRFLWLAGMDYQRELSRLLAGYGQTDPLRGMRIGERLSWLTTEAGGRNADSKAPRGGS